MRDERARKPRREKPAEQSNVEGMISLSLSASSGYRGRSWATETRTPLKNVRAKEMQECGRACDERDPFSLFLLRGFHCNRPLYTL
jgi:hypothetical protein